MSSSNDNSPFDVDPDPGRDPNQTLREIRESRPRVGCLGCVVSGGWAVAAPVGLVVLLVYLVMRLT
jgi:hypothetical protein